MGGLWEVITSTVQALPSKFQVSLQPQDALFLQVVLVSLSEVPTSLPFSFGVPSNEWCCCVLQRVRMQAQVVLTIIAILPVPRGPAVLLELTAEGELEGVGTCSPPGTKQCQSGGACLQGLRIHGSSSPTPSHLISYLLLRGHSHSIGKLVLS